jgi:hypothetical protein
VTIRIWSAALAIAFATIACNKSDGGKGQPSATASALVSAPTASASVAPAASGSAAPAVAGAGWSGDYTAKKAAIELPEKVKDQTWKHDPGDKSVGPGKLTISVADGVVTGTASGALGDQVVSGTLEGKALKLTLLPKNATAADAMTGTAVGEVGAASITGTIKCSGPDAVMIREASFELKAAK